MGPFRRLLLRIEWWFRRKNRSAQIGILAVGIVIILQLTGFLGWAIIYLYVFAVVGIWASLNTISGVSIISRISSYNPPEWFPVVEVLTLPFRLMNGLWGLVDIVDPMWTELLELFGLK